MKNNLRLIGIFIILIAMIATGYYTFIYFVKNIVPSFSSYGLIVVSIIAGVSMFFNIIKFQIK